MTDALIIDFNRLADPNDREEARRAAYKALFETPQGRLVLTDIVLGSGLAQIAYRAAAADPDARAFQAGREHMALSIFDLAAFQPVDAAEAIITAGENLDYDRPDEPIGD